MQLPDLSNIGRWSIFHSAILSRTSSLFGDPQPAFENWMERDGRFGEVVSQTARQAGLQVILVDGRVSIEENSTLVEKALSLER